MGSVSPQKEIITATAKERPNLLMEVKAESYYGLRTTAKKFKKFSQVENICRRHQNIMLNIERRKMKTKH